MMRKLKDLIENIEYQCIRGTEEIEVTEIVYDSRKVVQDSLFICFHGANADGHDYAAHGV